MSAQPHADVAGIVLAGGLSRRMGGGDKSLRMLGDRPMLAHVIERLAAQAAPIAINANGDPSRFAPYGLPVVADTIPDFAGPLAGVLAGMRWASRAAPGARFVVSAATDTPFFPLDLVARLRVAATAAGGERIALAASDDSMQPVFGLWPIADADALEQALRDGLRKILAWTDARGASTVHFGNVVLGSRMIDPFFNANRPEDLAEAAALLEGAAR